MEMRKAFCNYMLSAMAQDKRLCVLDADLGNADGTLPLRKEFPDRAFDVGIAEQNMASIAAGLSSYGFVPFITSFACFASRRICDQVAISCAYAKQNVKIVGTDPGITAELNGGTHMAVEDIGVLRSIPGIAIFEPSDEIELVKAMPQIIERPGPVYIRLHRKEVKALHGEDYNFQLGKADVLRPGKDVTLFASGSVMLNNAMEAAEELKLSGIEAEVVNIHTIKPLDSDAVLQSLGRTGAAVTCENHSILGGLHSAICEAAASGKPVPIEAIGFRDVCGQVGSARELAETYHMTARDITGAAIKVISRKSR